VKDLNKLVIDPRVEPDSPFGLLRGIQMGTESYHDLFKRLCRCGLSMFCKMLTPTLNTAVTRSKLIDINVELLTWFKLYRKRVSKT